MASVAIFSPTPTPNPITEYIPSAHTPDYLSNPNALINPDVSSVAGQPLKYWKHVAGAIQLMTQGERDTVDAAEATTLLTALRSGAVSIVDATDSDAKVLRAVLLLILDELNNIRQWLVSFKAETAASTNLANFQTRVGTLPNMPDRTAAQARTAIKNKIQAGDADN